MKQMMCAVKNSTAVVRLIALMVLAMLMGSNLAVSAQNGGCLYTHLTLPTTPYV